MEPDMQRYVIIDPNGVPVNVIEYTEAPSQPPPGFDEGFFAVQSDVADMTWTWDGSQLQAPPLPVYVPEVPEVVTPRQARLALSEAGLLPQVNAMIAGADEATQITWDYATFVKRSDPLIASIGGALNLTDEQIDALFVRAHSL